MALQAPFTPNWISACTRDIGLWRRNSSRANPVIPP